MIKRFFRELVHPTSGYLGALIYPIMFCKRPNEHVRRVVEEILPRTGATNSEYLTAIGLALQSDERLQTILPQDHSEEVIRDYLAAVADYIRSRNEG